MPYLSKDSPSLRSEFSHPEIVISLTLLTYYYEGLSDENMFESFQNLLKNDQSSLIYERWVGCVRPKLPEAFCSLAGVPIKDRLLCVEQVFPRLRYSKACIDYFTSHIVFPKQVRQFEKKLSASGWDLGKVMKHPTTGFSETCDTQYLLPLDVNQVKLQSQLHTNALVINNIFQSGATVHHLPPGKNASDVENLLTVLVEIQTEIRVILDCGALILEQTNQQVAETWLRSKPSNVQAAIFFKGEVLSVLEPFRPY